MISIGKLIDSGECHWCRKEKEVCEVALDNGTTINLCWNDLKRAVKTGLLTSERNERKALEKV
jgi:hypothetical protein